MSLAEMVKNIQASILDKYEVKIKRYTILYVFSTITICKPENITCEMIYKLCIMNGIKALQEIESNLCLNCGEYLDEWYSNKHRETHRTKHGNYNSLDYCQECWEHDITTL